MVAIKDMEMPESCYECIVKNHCGVGIADGWRTDRRADDCPLAEIEERKVGKWLVKDNGNGGKYVECPFCGALAPCTEFADRTVWKYSKFCYDCGNEMRGAENE